MGKDEAIRESLEVAFSDERLPHRPITGHRCLECDEVDALMGGRAWPSVADDFPHYCHNAFPLLTAAAKKYYLPAFMVAALRSDCGLQGISLESAFSSGGLMPEEFSTEQRRVIVTWLKSYWELMYPGKGVPDKVAAKWGDVES